MTAVVYPMTPLKIISFKHQKEFDKINLLGKKIICRYFIMIFEKQPVDSACIYLGLKISRKFGNAVIRNKARRRLKHMMRDFVRTDDGSQLLGSKFLFIPRNSMMKAKYAELLEEVRVKLLSITSKS